MSIKEILNVSFQGITAFSILFAVIQIQINKKQLNASVIKNCIDSFRSLNLRSAKDSTQEVTIKYIDLVNEELFYIQNGYLPKDVSMEWIDGMLDYMPLILNEKIIFNPHSCMPFFNQSKLHCLDSFPRVRKSFFINKEYDLDLIYSNNSDISESKMKERKEIIKTILLNIKKYKI